MAAPFSVLSILILTAGVKVYAQGRGGPPGPPPVPKATAPIDLTGYCLSLVTVTGQGHH